MKTLNVISIASLLLISLNAHSTVHVVNQTGMYFSPANVIVNVGDIVRWNWSSDSHTTTSKTIPAGALAWDAPLNSSHASFEYTVTVAGSYSYVCTYHESMGMVGTITAVATTTGIGENPSSQAFSVYPNPAKSFINLKTDMMGKVVISNVLGKSVKVYQSTELPVFNDSYRLDLSDLDGGAYIISFLPSNSKKRLSIKFIKE